MATAAVVGSYLYALGADREVEHARAMAVAMLLATSVGSAAGLTALRGLAARGLAAATLASVVLLVQVPAFSHWLSLRPLHADDWALVVFGFAVAGALALALAARLKRDAA